VTLLLSGFIPINKENEMFVLGLFLTGLAVGYNGIRSPMAYIGIAGIALISYAHSVAS